MTLLQFILSALFTAVAHASEETCDTFYVCDDAECESLTCLEHFGTYTKEKDARPLWLILAGSQIFCMQLGFSNLEAGSVSRRNVQNILFKNIMDVCMGTIVWFCLGYGAAWGSGSFIGTNKFFVVNYHESTDWFFQWAFCVTDSTIVSGAVAERMKLEAYFVYIVVITALIYPAVVHWVWSEEGFASAFNTEATNPIVDFAGSGVVHMVGGFSGLMGAYFVGPRPGRFKNPTKYKNHSVPYLVFGTITLWFGWYGFNCGSTVAVDGAMGTAALVAVTTTLGAASGGVTSACIEKLRSGKWNIGEGCNGVLAGLVSVTAGCAVVAPEISVLIGSFGGLVYYGFSKMMVALEIDDPIDAAAVHGAAGLWGIISTGLFATESRLIQAGYVREAGLGHGTRIWNQIAVGLAIMFWTIGTSGIMFYCAKITMGIRTEAGGEIGGIDLVDFGVEAYESPVMDRKILMTALRGSKTKTEAGTEAGATKSGQRTTSLTRGSDI